MKAQTAKKTGAVLGAVALVSAGVASVAPVVAEAESPAVGAVQTVDATAAASTSAAPVLHGVFTYDQSVVTANANITNVFGKASAVLCNAMPSYGAIALSQAIAVSGDVDAAFEATVAEMASNEDARRLVMACGCASNVPGGGAIANAEVSGVMLEAIANRAQAY